MRKWRWVILLGCLPLFAAAAAPVWTEPGADGVQVHLYLFWSKNCPHCLEARPRLLDLAARNAWVRLQDFELSEHRGNVERFVALAKQVGGEARAVPTLIYCGRMEVGLDSSDAGMAKLLGRLQACRALHGTAADSGTASRSVAWQPPSSGLMPRPGSVHRPHGSLYPGCPECRPAARR